MTTDEYPNESTTDNGGEVVLIPVMIRLPPARIAQIDHKVKVEKTHTTRAGFCRDAVIAALDSAPEKDLTEEMIKEIESGNLDDALKDRIKSLFYSPLCSSLWQFEHTNIQPSTSFIRSFMGRVSGDKQNAFSPS